MKPVVCRHIISRKVSLRGLPRSVVKPWQNLKTVEVAKGRHTHGCHRGCVIRCSGTFRDKDGNFITKQPEYETVWAHGPNCGIDDLDVIAALDRMDDNFGVDTIEMGGYSRRGHGSRLGKIWG